MKRSVDTTPLTSRLAALAEPIRLRLCRVLEQEELTVGEVARVVQLPQSTVSRHLKVLSESGWVRHRSEGTASVYSLRLDDLAPPARSLWVTVRDQADDDAEHADDLRRVRTVLGERRTDSRTFFGKVAGEWDGVREELFGGGFTARALLAMVPKHWTVADVGCGTGNAAVLLAPHVREVIAVDRSEPMLEAARQRLAGVTNVRFVAGELESLPLADASVDAVTCVLVLHHMEEPVAALKEMRRVIRPGGAALVLDMYAHEREEYRSTMGHEHLGFEERTLARAFETAGFETPSIAVVPTSSEARGPGLFVAIGHVAGGGGSDRR